MQSNAMATTRNHHPRRRCHRRRLTIAATIALSLAHRPLAAEARGATVVVPGGGDLAFLAAPRIIGDDDDYCCGKSSSRRRAAAPSLAAEVGRLSATMGTSPPPMTMRSFLPSHHHRRLRRPRASHTALASTTARGGGGRGTGSARGGGDGGGGGYDVLYQKVLRAPPPVAAGSSSSSSAFLLNLVSYLQCVFELPRDLPMPYAIAVPEDDDEAHDGDGGRAVLIIDSPLSRDPYGARLEVEVIGIFPDGGGGTAVGPTMAMVALKKRRDPNDDDDSGGGGGGGGGVSRGLFAASEKRISRALDRGLQDLEEGRVSIPRTNDDMGRFDDDDDGVDQAVKRIAYRNAVEAAVSTSIKQTQRGGDRRKVDSKFSIERDALGNVIIDSVAVTPAAVTPAPPALSTLKKTRQRDDEGKDAKRSKGRLEDEQVGSTGGSSSSEILPSSSSTATPGKISEQSRPGDEDYAIRMARERAEALMTTVRAGKTTSRALGTVAISGGEGDFAILAAKRAAAATAANRLKGSENPAGNIRWNVRDKEGGNESKVSAPIQKGGGVQDLSSDATFLKLRTIANAAKGSSWKSTISRMKKEGGVKSSLGGGARSDSRTVSTSKSPGTNIDKTDDEIRDDVMQIARGNESVQRELRAATTDLMKEVDMEDEDDLSPEELLRRVLKFGDEKDDEQKPGIGFVEGAFGKAKELLKTENNQYTSLDNLDFEDRGSFDEKKRKEEEAELRRIFSAGQSLAENRLTQAISSPPSTNLSMPSISDDDINELIDADGTVPRNARVLDDELASLEVRIGRSPGEGADGRSKNKLFDVFSGPEVYNPNVDPETAVNWPGAKGGTRTDVQLAADLSTALKQAQFASAVLSHMREEIDEENVDQIRYYVGSKELPLERVDLLRKCVNEAVNAGLIEDPEQLLFERSRLQMLIDELLSQPEERLEEIALNYKDLLLSDNLVDHMKKRLYAMSQRDLDARKMGNEDSLKIRHDRERAIMVNLAQIAQALVKEAQALGAELEVSMLEIIRSICEVAMDPRHKSEDETAVALTDAVRDMRPLLDDALVAYLKYAIAEEEGKLARDGVLDDPEHNRWLFVLKIVQEGVYSELSRGVKRHIDHIWYVLRMKSKSERKELLEKLIDVMPTMDVRPFVRVVNNIVSSLGTTVKGDFTDGVILGEMTNELLQLKNNLDEFLPPERINELSKGADAWAAQQRQKLLERRNLTRQRLEAARQTGDIDPDVVIKKPGVEADRFD